MIRVEIETAYVRIVTDYATYKAWEELLGGRAVETTTEVGEGWSKKLAFRVGETDYHICGPVVRDRADTERRTWMQQPTQDQLAQQHAQADADSLRQQVAALQAQLEASRKRWSEQLATAVAAQAKLAEAQEALEHAKFKADEELAAAQPHRR